MQMRRNAADRIRPFLEAMERSIEDARRERTHGDEPAHRREVPQAAPVARPAHTDDDEDDRPVFGQRPETAAPLDPTRMKARPKRRD